MKIIAHRGNDGVHKENSVSAILNSLNQDYVDGVEFDIRMTKDHKFVIHHDPFYDGKLISITKYRSLKGLTRLDSLLKKIHSHKIIMIEIKEVGENKLLIYYLYRVLKKYSLNYYICSFNYKLMKYFLKRHPEITNGLIIGMRLNIKELENDFDFNSINYKYVERVTAKETFIWTVNSRAELDLVPSSCNVITDNPRYISELIKRD